MKIISKYKDYYDSVQSLGIDQTLIYMRKKETIHLETLPDYNNILAIKGGDSIEEIIVLEADKYGDEIAYVDVKKIVIGFCGRLIPAFQLDEYHERKLVGSKTFYNAKNLSTYFNENKKRFEPDGFFKGHSIRKMNSYLEATIFEKDFSSWFQRMQCPIFQILNNPKNKSLNPYKHSNEIIIKKNPILKELDFYKVKDAYTAHQDISQYLGGVLTSREALKDNLTNIEKVKKHGFDDTYGFRTRPKK